MVQKQIVPDTNFIVSLLRQRRDFEEEVKSEVPGKARIILLDLVILELEHLARKGPASVRTWANTSLTLLDKRHYPIAEHKPGPTEVDASLIAFALMEKTPTAVATLDRELRIALKALNIPTIRPRAGHGLVTDSFHS